MQILKSQPKVSVLIPLYQQELFFEKCISSICKQSYKNLEIIVVNDGSTDGSSIILEKWAEKDIRIKAINKKNEGVLKARYDAYRMATGDFIAVVDSDDYIPKKSIELLLESIVREDVDVVLGSRKRVIGPITCKNDGKLYTFPIHKKIKQPELFNKYYLNFFGGNSFSIMITGNLYRKSVIDNALKHTKLCCDEIPFVGEDHYAFMQLFPFIRSMYRISETTYYYRYGGASSDHFSPTYPSLFFLSDKRLELLNHFGLKDGYRTLFEEYSNCIIAFVQQLIYYKQFGVRDVVDFLSEEIKSRKLIPQMKSLFNEEKIRTRGVQLIINEDYEGIFNYSDALLQKRIHSLKFKAKKFYLRIMKV